MPDREQRGWAPAVVSDAGEDDIHVAIVDHGAEVVRELNGAGFAAERRRGLRRIAHGNARHFNTAARATFDFFLVAAQYGEGAAAYRAEAQQSNFDRFHAACVFE